MTIGLENLANTSRPKKRRKIVGRGPGSKHGKTSCRGHKGSGARSGAKRRLGSEGGGVPLYRRVPTRGFSNGRFRKRLDSINLAQVEELYTDGETLSLETLRAKKFIKGKSYGVKLLGRGDLTKKVTVQVASISEGAKKKLKEKGVTVV